MLSDSLFRTALSSLHRTVMSSPPQPPPSLRYRTIELRLRQVGVVKNEPHHYHMKPNLTTVAFPLVSQLEWRPDHKGILGNLATNTSNYLKSSLASRNWSWANCMNPACCRTLLYITCRERQGQSSNSCMNTIHSTWHKSKIFLTQTFFSLMHLFI